MASEESAAFAEELAAGTGGANDADVHIEKVLSDVLEDVAVDAATCCDGDTLSNACDPVNQKDRSHRQSLTCK